jgi:hypothetical protein
VYSWLECAVDSAVRGAALRSPTTLLSGRRRSASGCLLSNIRDSASAHGHLSTAADASITLRFSAVPNSQRYAHCACLTSPGPALLLLPAAVLPLLLPAVAASADVAILPIPLLCATPSADVIDLLLLLLLLPALASAVAPDPALPAAACGSRPSSLSAASTCANACTADISHTPHSPATLHSLPATGSTLCQTCVAPLTLRHALAAIAAAVAS